MKVNTNKRLDLSQISESDKKELDQVKGTLFAGKEITWIKVGFHVGLVKMLKYIFNYSDYKTFIKQEFSDYRTVIDQEIHKMRQANAETYFEHYQQTYTNQLEQAAKDGTLEAKKKELLHKTDKLRLHEDDKKKLENIINNWDKPKPSQVTSTLPLSSKSLSEITSENNAIYEEFQNKLLEGLPKNNNLLAKKKESYNTLTYRNSNTGRSKLLCARGIIDAILQDAKNDLNTDTKENINSRLTLLKENIQKLPESEQPELIPELMKYFEDESKDILT